MTGLQADQQDGCDNYAGIFFPCLALMATACYCVFAIPAWDLGQTHTAAHARALQDFFLLPGACNVLVLCALQARAGGMGQI